MRGGVGGEGGGAEEGGGEVGSDAERSVGLAFGQVLVAVTAVVVDVVSAVVVADAA